MIKKLYILLASAIAIAVLVTAFMAYFMRTADIENQLLYDGLGRLLTEPPALAKIFIISEHSWAGFWWHIADIIWFFGGFFIAFKLYEKGAED